MSPEAWISLAAVAVSVIGLTAALAVAYGSLKAMVEALSARLTAVEGEVGGLTAMKADLARIDERTSGMKTGIDAILNSWLLREPPGYEPKAPTTTRRRGA